MDNLKLWISQNGFSAPNCNFHTFQYSYLKVRFDEFKKCNFDSTENAGYHVLLEKF